MSPRPCSSALRVRLAHAAVWYPREQGDYPKAIEDFSAVLTADPSHADALKRRGQTHAARFVATSSVVVVVLQRFPPDLSCVAVRSSGNIQQAVQDLSL